MMMALLRDIFRVLGCMFALSDEKEEAPQSAGAESEAA